MQYSSFSGGAMAVPGIYQKTNRNNNSSRGCTAPTNHRKGQGDETYDLLMELAAQEPTIQNCLKIIQSTCLAQGLEMRIGNKGKPSDRFQRHLQRHYMLFCEQAIRCMFVCGFVPWRLRMLSTGDPVPEVLPLGMFMWTIETIPDSVASSYSSHGRHSNSSNTMMELSGKSNFKKQQQFFNSSRYTPYRIESDNQSMNKNKNAMKKPAGVPNDDKKNDDNSVDMKNDDKKNEQDDEQMNHHYTKRSTMAYMRQQLALKRQGIPDDDESTKSLRYRVHFTENFDIMEDEVEVYEYIQPNRDVTYHSTMYRTIPSPLAHIINDYRNLRRAVIQREYADTWNSQAKMICSYTNTKSQYNLSEGNPITNDWVMPQNRLGLTTDTNLPSEIEQNAYVRDAVTETIISSKNQPHKPTIYTLPKNSKLETAPKLECLQDIKELQMKMAKDIACIMGIPYEIIGGGYSDKEGKKKSMENTRIFTTNMMSVCSHLENLMRDAYCATYGDDPSNVKFTLRPTPRIEIGSVEEIVMLLDAGIVSFENAMQISNMLLGVDLQHSAGKKANAGQFSKAYVTPAQKKDLIVAQSALVKANQKPTTSSSKK